MSGMLETIKKASMGAVNASNPLDIEFGTVLDADNLTIRLDQKRVLPREFFVLPAQLTKYTIDLSHTHPYSGGSTGESLKEIVIREGLKTGDIVALLKIERGSRFLILDKVVGDND